MWFHTAVKSPGAGAMLAVAFLLAVTAPVDAQETRAEIAAEQRRAKSRELRPKEPNRVEQAFIRFSDERVLERWFNPRRGLFARMGLPTEGAAFGGGPAWRISPPGRPYTVTASAAASISREWLGELDLQIPDVLPRVANDRFFAGFSVSRSGRIENEFWGLGNTTTDDSRTIFRVAQTAAGGTFGVRLMPWLSVSVAAARLTPRIKDSRNNRAGPPITVAFNESTAPGLTSQPPFFRSDIAVDLDYRESSPPTRTAVRLDRLPLAGASRGGRYQVTLASYDDREFNRYSFRKTTIDLQQFVPLLHGHRVVAFRALAVLSDPSGAQAVPFYLSPTFGGLFVGRGYPTLRFRDRNLLALQAEYRYQVNPLVSGALFVDAGQVAPRVRAFDWSKFKKTYGAGVRFGAGGGAGIRFDLAFKGHHPVFILGLGHAF
jgi:outer membrane protein assembly factor BamA